MNQKNIYLYNPAFDTNKTPSQPDFPTPEVTPLPRPPRPVRPENPNATPPSPDMEFPTPEVTPDTDTTPDTETAPDLDLELDLRVEVPNNVIRARYNGYNPPIYG